MSAPAASATRVLFLVQVAATLAMAGVIWFVQIVHYPLFAEVGTDRFIRYEAIHATRTGWVVAPLMLAEITSALLMLWPDLRMETIPAWSAWAGAALVVSIWLSTGLVQVPLHNRLAAGYDATLVLRLVGTNWIRTIAWSARAALVLWWIKRGLER